jgi:hypothetical protein
LIGDICGIKIVRMGMERGQERQPEHESEEDQGEKNTAFEKPGPGDSGFVLGHSYTMRGTCSLA